MASSFQSNPPGEFNPRLITRAVVLEFLSNPIEFLDEGKLGKLFEEKKGILIGAPEGIENSLRFQIKIAPRNSILGVQYTSTGIVMPRIYYPFFSSHMCLPVKPGESVWILQPGVEKQATARPGSSPSKASKGPGQKKSALPGDKINSGFWMSRIAEPVYVEDANFTHGPRSSSGGYFAESSMNTSALDGSPRKPTDALTPAPFNNGIYTQKDGPEHPKILKGKVDFDFINKNALSNQHTTREPVPVFTQRPGDFVMQGSNNTLICLGEDRPPTEDPDNNLAYPAGNNEGTQSGPRKQGYAGTIDIVAGRSIDAEDFLKENVPTTVNDRDEVEKEKRTWAKSPQLQREVKVAEGDPDFAMDLSRVYVSMKTDGDKNFGFEDPASLPKVDQNNELTPVESSPYIVSKSKEIRIISRDDGSVRIIKEGVRAEDGSAGDQAVISMLSDGTVLIDAPKVVIGSNATEAMVLGNELKKLLSRVLNSMTTNMDKFVATGAGPGILNPAILDAIIKTHGELDKMLSKISKVK
jgi:hypothetical protein